MNLRYVVEVGAGYCNQPHAKGRANKAPCLAARSRYLSRPRGGVHALNLKPCTAVLAVSRSVPHRWVVASIPSDHRRLPSTATGVSPTGRNQHVYGDEKRINVGHMLLLFNEIDTAANNKEGQNFCGDAARSRSGIPFVSTGDA